MDAQILHPHPHAVKHHRYVAATPEAQAAEEAKVQRQIGRNYYRRGKPLRECVTDDMAAGWLAAERAGAEAYYGEMIRQASDRPVNYRGEFVNWNSRAEAEAYR